ncbi:MAG TPA: hypothetical protein VH415_07405 [Nitrososphaeraceae archaeon]|jgi:hypothetical protein
MINFFDRHILRSNTSLVGVVRVDKQFKAVVNKCDLCDEPIPCLQDVEIKISLLKEIDDSYESLQDKQEPRLLLCDNCRNEYLIPGYSLT